MARWYDTLIIGGLLAAVAHAPPVRAADGRITFSGAIRAPTCAVMPEDAMAAIAGAPGSRPRTCAMPGDAAGNSSGKYTLSASRLDGIPMDDRLRPYFAEFVAIVDVPAQARQIIQTYQ